MGTLIIAHSLLPFPSLTSHKHQHRFTLIKLEQTPEVLPCTSASRNPALNMESRSIADDGATFHVECNTAVEANEDAKPEISTICYEHESFEAFKHKVTEVVAASLSCDKSVIHTERMKGGAFNCVVGVTVRAPKTKRSCLSWAQKTDEHSVQKSPFNNSQSLRCSHGMW
jgi:hypothetical protein